jgi:hypothetical protein
MVERSASAPNHMRRLAIAILLTVALAITAQSAHAVPDYLTAFEAQYPAAVGSRIDTCNLCHTAAIPQLNPYGMAYQGAGHQFAPIENLDSDGDGYTNLAEIMALSFPGDPADAGPCAAATTTPLPATATATLPNRRPRLDEPHVSTTATVTITLSGTATITGLGRRHRRSRAASAADRQSGAPTNTSGAPTNTPGPPPTITPRSPTHTNTPGGTPGTTPSRTLSGGSPTVSPTTSPARTAIINPRSDSDSCSIVAPERSGSIGGLALLLAPALLIWARRRL